MTTASDLRAEAQRMREFASGVTDAEVRAEIQELIDELERRARQLGNGDGQQTHGRHAAMHAPDSQWNSHSHP
jgi:hypothetical protein